MMDEQAGSSSREGANDSEERRSRRGNSNKRPSSPSSDRDAPTPTSSSNPKKIIEVACWNCRKRKGKCTGERPACSFCANRGVECSYEYEEGLTRLGSLRQSLEKVTARADNLEFLFGQLQSRSDNDAACLLAVIRMGADLDMICEKLRSEPDFLAQPDLSQLMLK